MRISIINMIKQGMLFLLPLFVLTACSGRDEMVLSQDGQKQAWEKEEDVSGTISDAEPVISSEEGGMPESELQKDCGAKTGEKEEIFVHICGAVANPGVYMLASGSRIFEGVEAAGGFREDACEDYVNQAKPLQDGQRLVIPTVEEVEAAKENGDYKEDWMMGADTEEAVEAANQDNPSSVMADGTVNINTATENELSSINGIGAGKAAAIIKYRQDKGGFASIEEIMEVSGIGKGIFEKIKDKITVN